MLRSKMKRNSSLIFLLGLFSFFRYARAYLRTGIYASRKNKKKIRKGNRETEAGKEIMEEGKVKVHEQSIDVDNLLEQRSAQLQE